MRITLSSPSQKKAEKNLPLLGFEPGSPRPQSKSDDLDRSAMGLATLLFLCQAPPVAPPLVGKNT